MKLSHVKLKGFRNFKDCEICFQNNTLIIGANDVGKTNLLWALRLLLDKSLSEYDIEPRDSDFYAFDDINEFEISIKFEENVEDCIWSKLKGKISDNNELYLVYKGHKDVTTKVKSYNLFAGSSPGTLEEIEERFYRKVLNLKYISCRRDFYKFINNEKQNLFALAKQNRTGAEIESDNSLYAEISTRLKDIDDKIPKLSFIATATKAINQELEKLSIHHKRQQIVFDAGTSDIENFISDVSISSKNNDRSLLIGGDGRLNQVYLSLWASRNDIADDTLQEVSIICIEEPEAHLHPHQQRKLSEYLSTAIKSQVIITSHSPQIACEYSPNAIIKLVEKGDGTFAASNGCSKIIEEAFADFGYRLSIVPAEAFFADVVLLVEGPSEELFYKTLAHQLGIDLDRLNISVLMVDGIGFSTFIKILDSLEIDWVLRTDNDISKVPKKNCYRYAGIQRLVSYYKQSIGDCIETDNLLAEHGAALSGFAVDIPVPNQEAAELITNEMEKHNLFLSERDLEHDLFDSPLMDVLNEFFGKQDDIEDDGTTFVQKMQTRKAVYMYEFLRHNKDKLSVLADHSLVAPLYRCREIISRIHNETNRATAADHQS